MVPSSNACLILGMALVAAGCRGKETGDGPTAPTVPTTETEPGPHSEETEETEETEHTEETEETEDSEEPVPPAPSAVWVRDAMAAPGSIAFSELQYHPAGDGVEWIELHNPMALDMDLTGWSLSGAVDYAFADGVVVPAGGYLVIAADPAALAAETGFAEAIGPLDGSLGNGGERVSLVDNAGRVIDTVNYGDDDPWPVGADGSGHSLAKIDPDHPSDHAEHWTISVQPGGTPGAPNLVDPSAPPLTLTLVPIDAVWRYDASGATPAADWAGPAYDDGAWPEGAATFYFGGVAAPADAVLSATADNHYALYLGQADASDLVLVGDDVDGSWTTVDRIDVEVLPTDHLFVVAWEDWGDGGSPQSVIAEAVLPDGAVGTDIAGFEWLLGPTGANPGFSPPAPAPLEADLRAVIAEGDALGAWDAPAVEADRYADPWGWAVGASFTDAARFVWGDTFDSDSVTNREETYAVFRSVAPLLGSRGATELVALPTTTLFRTSFGFDGDAAWTELLLACEIDDGAVAWLNGVELARVNLPPGPVGGATLASSSVDPALEWVVAVPSDALVRGTNVLAVEVHQATAPDPDLTFACALTAVVSAAAVGPSVVLDEVPAASEAPFWVEIAALADRDLGGVVLASDAGAFVVPSDTLLAGERLVVEDVGFEVASGDVLFLYEPDGVTLIDAVRVHDAPRARDGEAGPWRVPTLTTPWEPNVVELVEDVVINEIQYHRAPLSRAGDPITARDEEWIELYNRGTDAVDLGGWQLVDAVAYVFPDGTTLAPGAYVVVANDADALRAAYPGVDVVGDFEGRLDNRSDRILLRDARGNLADEVRYYDGGRWPEAADGGGSSVELRDPWADNGVGEAWAPSDELPRSAWVDVTYRAVASPSAVGPDGTWHELVIGLLDAGEVLIDDVSVVEQPATAAIEVVEGGGFDGGVGPWRVLGNHRHSSVVPDPDDPSNPVLRLVATGPTGHMHNHAELTLARPIGNREYEISFRARWVSGSNQLHTRLYFNRMARTTLIEQPELSGTPGSANSVATDNLGPTFDAFEQSSAVPPPYVPIEVSALVDDPDGVVSVTMWSSVDGGAFSDQPMAPIGGGRWQATLAGRAAGSVVQVYLEAEDTLGARATFPAAGPDARLLMTFDDGRAASNGLHNVRILMTAADAAWMHEDVNLMSDDDVGATVIYDERVVFWDAGVRLKGSQRGRPTTSRLGYGLSFSPDQPFRGSHTSVLVDRSEGVGYGQREVLLNLVQTHAGSVSAEYNDLTHAITPYPEHTGAAELQLDRTTSVMLDAQFADGADGTVFEYELIYYPYTTDDGTPTGLKLPQPDSVIGTSIRDLGADPEAYRWAFLISNNEREDDYAGVLELGQLFSLSDAAFRARAADVIDVDAWLRGFAFASLAGVVDQYGGDGSQHNAKLYVRPEDGRVLYFPHDLDFFGSWNMSVVGNGDLRRLIADPVYARLYYGHLLDILDRSYDAAHLAPWCDQMAALLPAQPIASHCAFIGDRADWVRSGSPESVARAIPEVDFQITTAGGADFSVKGSEVVLQGEGWVDVVGIELGGAPLTVTWLDEVTWEVVVPLEEGANPIVLVARDRRGQEVGTDSAVVTSTGT